MISSPWPSGSSVVPVLKKRPIAETQNTMNPSDIKDIDDYRAVYGPGSLKELLKTAQPVVIPPDYLPPPVQQNESQTHRAKRIRFCSPSELRDFVPGAGLKNVLAGSYVLTSVPRCVFLMVRATEEETDERVVFCNPKNNDGSLVTRTAWLRTGTGYEAIGEFDWEEFENQGEKRKAVTLEDVREAFEKEGKEQELEKVASKSQLTFKP